MSDEPSPSSSTPSTPTTSDADLEAEITRLAHRYYEEEGAPKGVPTNIGFALNAKSKVPSRRGRSNPVLATPSRLLRNPSRPPACHLERSEGGEAGGAQSKDPVTTDVTSQSLNMRGGGVWFYPSIKSPVGHGILRLRAAHGTAGAPLRMTRVWEVFRQAAK